MKKNSEDITIPGRHMIALNRTKAPVKVGDLKIRGTILKAECLLYANSGIRHLRRYFDGNAPRIIEEYLRELLVDDLLTMGSQKMIAGKKKTYLAPIYTDTIMKMATVIKKWEEIQDTWEASAIKGSVYNNPPPITREENQILKDKGLTTVSQLLCIEEPTSLSRQAALDLPGNLKIKIIIIVTIIKNRRMEFRNAPLRRNHAESILRDKPINLSHIIKKADKTLQEESGQWHRQDIG